MSATAYATNPSDLRALHPSCTLVAPARLTLRLFTFHSDDEIKLRCMRKARASNHAT